MKKHITTVTLNPCIDRTIILDNFKPGGTNHVKNIREDIAGKGINVAVALKYFEIPCKCIGFGFDRDFEKMVNFFEEHSLLHGLVRTEGNSRVNLKIFDNDTKQMTECNEKGKLTNKESMNEFYHMLKDELTQAQLLVVDGSVPQGVESDCYAKIICEASTHDVPVILDATGDLLLEGIKEKPFLIKPNKEEFCNTFCCEEKDMEKKALELVKNGIQYVCISLGEEGAMLVTQKGIQKMPAISVPVRSLQGAGDAMVAGMCKAIWDKNESQLLTYALCSAASAVSHEGTQMGSLDEFNKLLHQIMNS